MGCILANEKRFPNPYHQRAYMVRFTFPNSTPHINGTLPVNDVLPTPNDIQQLFNSFVQK